MRDDQFSLESIGAIQPRPRNAAPQLPAAKPIVDRLLAKLKSDAIAANAQLAFWKNNGKGYDEDFHKTYQHWLEQHIEDSGLAQLIPGGADALPDLRDRMSPVFKLFYRIPKTPEALLEHLYNYLEIYLNPIRRIGAPSWLTATVAGIVLGAIFTGALLPVIGTSAIAIGLIALFGVLVMCFLDSLPHGRLGIRRTVNIITLEWYLRNTYGDPDPDLEAQELDVDWS